ncbi:16S rRNA (uracil(1498)-N(3))-methyltransferase [Permianibacter aggregans]|uniref:Ribosomal RNA small subunit methyltransferase E n=1 Tax=Permianibacter aggregans TaxID=1510150 RepID=A0A4R6UTB1_9GAMM|nr:16S rRNA (uracil(1498)-N(3))-methyltransferase [Permianibacter aggregans]QGX40365.1 16S rRNA (uracil(1498)-N(3))-methyltransferase [Permianibacter aggregans]TDQ49506.1 16S rRNA m(3)U-1498 methyltransferase [Permianibacter aggregans]
MRITRLYVDLPLQTGRKLSLPENAANHVARVLRMRVGDAVQLFNGDGHAYDATISHVDKRDVGVDIHQMSEQHRESPLSITLIQGVSRGDRMEITIQKAVELGVGDIHPVITERCGVQLDEQRWQKKQEHWQAIVHSACEQCGRNRVPTVHPVRKLDLVLADVSTAHRFTLQPDAEQGFGELKLHGDVTLLIGPEGGLGDLDLYQASAAQFIGVRMGPRILRTETAALTALACLQALHGDLR